MRALDFRKSTRHRYSLKRKILYLVLAAFALAVVALSIAIIVILRNLPQPEYLFSRRVVQSTKIFDRTGSVLLFEIHGEEKRTVVPFAEIPTSVKNATVAIEDANFYRHSGIDFRGILRALIKDILSRDLRQGGSTITQQLVKNALLGSERTLARKFKEAVLALSLESRLDKDEILNLYLNQIPYGQNAYGIEAAAETYFGKHAEELDLSQSALLAALPRAPSYYSPYGQHKDELLKRKNAVLDRMAELGFLKPDDASQAKQEQLDFLPAAKNIRAPHFSMFVRDYLIDRYGEEEVETGGLIVTTTLDWALEEEAEKIVSETAQSNEKLIKAKNMALVAINPKNGQILSMVGSRDYFDVQNDGNFNVATALRQPGSSFKPFVYSTAFKKGFAPKTVLFDLPTEFNPKCGPDGLPRSGSNINPKDCYHPQNYDETFRGPVTIRQALAQSLNVPSVKLLYLAGVEDSIKTAESMGLSSLGARSRFGLSLVLGGAEVKLLEMTNAYGVFANDGVFNPLTAVLKVESSNGRVLEENQNSAQPIMDPDVARTISDILSDNDARVPVFSPRSSLYFADRQVAVKTGTTQDYRDAWTIGYTPSIVAGVWAGNNDNSPIQQKGSGVMAAAPAWRSFMNFALKNSPPEEFLRPPQNEPSKPVLKGIWQGDTVVTIDTVSQKIATDLTPPETRKDVAYGTPHDPLFWLDRSDPTGPPPQDPANDPQYPNWSAAFDKWLQQSGFASLPLSAAPQDYDDIHTPDKQPQLKVVETADQNGNLTIRVNFTSPLAVKNIILLADERIVDTRPNPTSPVEFFISKDKTPPGSNLEVRAYDIVGNIGSAVVSPPSALVP